MRTPFPVIPVAFLVVTALLSSCTRSPKPVSASTWESALLAENWTAVAADCSNQPDASAVLRALRGHACLALNRNDESLALFRSLANDRDRRAWQECASGLVARHPSSPVALYLKGDGLARSGHWSEAIEAYSAALRLNGRFALALNARGVALVALNNQDRALADFEAACQAGPNFADAFASLGALLVLRNAPEGALAMYQAAVAKSHQFALSLNGRACARLVGRVDPSAMADAVRDYLDAAKCPAVKELAETNLRTLATIALSPDGSDLAGNPGMTLNANQLRSLSNEQRMEYLNTRSAPELLTLSHDAGRNQAWSRGWGEAVQSTRLDEFKVNKLVEVRIPFTNVEQSFRHAAEHKAVLNDIQQVQHDKYGVRLDLGGITMAHVQSGFLSFGGLVRTRFGLDQDARDAEVAPATQPVVTTATAPS